MTDRFTVDSWRSDAYDPANDAPDTAPVRNPRTLRNQIELSPGVWVYPEYIERMHKHRRAAELYGDLDNWT
jgi:hypothetical protein